MNVRVRVCDLFPYDLVGRPGQRRGDPGTAQAALHPSSSSPSSVCDRMVCPQTQRHPASLLLGHTAWGHVHIHNCKKRKKRKRQRQNRRMGGRSRASQDAQQIQFLQLSVITERVFCSVFIRGSEGEWARQMLWPQIDARCHVLHFARSYLFDLLHSNRDRQSPHELTLLNSSPLLSWCH